MDLSDIDMLKKLDDMEAKKYADNKEDLAASKSHKNSIKSDFADFDDIADDDDLADLLYDDDDIVKKKPKSPKHETVMNVSTFGPSSSSSVQKEVLGAGDKMTSDVVRTRKKSTELTKTAKNKIDLFLQDEEKYLGDLGVNELENISTTSKFSNEQSTPKVSNEQSMSSPLKSKLLSRKSVDVEFDDDNTILDSLDGQKESSPAKAKRQSFMDDLLGKNTQQSPVRKITSRFDHPLEDSLKEGEKDDIMVYGGYVPSASSTSRTSASSRHQSSLFEDQSPSKDNSSPVRERRPRTGLAEEVVQSSRRPRATSAIVGENHKDKKKIDFSLSPEKKKEDTWQDLLKKESGFNPSLSPKKIPENDATKTSDSVMRRKDSGADWLGYESPETLKNTVDKTTAQSEIRVGHSPSVGGGHKKEQYPWLSNNSPPVSRRRVEASHERPLPSPMPPLKPTESTVPLPTPVSTNQVLSHSTPQVLYSGKPENINPTVSQGLFDTLQLEKDQLQKTIESMSSKKEEDLKNFEESLKKQHRDLEESFQLRIKAIQDEHAIDLKKMKAEFSSMQSDKKQLSEEYQQRFAKLDSAHEKEIQRLKDFHNEAVTLLKQDHEDSMKRMKRMRDQELEAITATQSQSKSLQLLSDQLEARTAELASLQKKVEEKHQTAVQEREALLLTKEKDLKALESRLRWQMEEGDQERSRLQQLVLRLEKRLELQTKESEEDRWNVQQLKAKLQVQQTFLEEEKKMSMESIEREKEKLRISQDCFLQEQKTILIQLGQERQQISSDRCQLESLAKRVRDEEARFTARKISEEGNAESFRRNLEQENEKLYIERELAKQETLKIRTEREALERERRQFKDDKEKLEEMKCGLKKKTDNLEDMTRKVLYEKEESREAMTAARRIESDHHSRMNQFTRQMQDIMEMEKALLLEREKIAEEKREFEKTKDNALCINCKLAVGLPFTARPPTLGQTQESNFIQTAGTVDPNLMVWYITAEKDREYLQEQLMFLKSLKELKKM